MSSITKPSRKPSATAFVAAAPDARSARAPAKANRRQITLTVPDEILRRLDTLAEQNGQSRASLIMLGISRVLRDGL